MANPTEPQRASDSQTTGDEELASDNRTAADEEAASKLRCDRCGELYDVRYSKDGLCFTCAVHFTCACADETE